MSEDQIVVQLNPDVPPTGSDLGIVNAARRSFGKRSEWDWDTPAKGKPAGASYRPMLKDKDKRLLEFLARGITADDFEAFKLEVGSKGLDWLYYMDNDKEQELVDLLWQWRNTPTHDTPFNHGFFSFEVKAPIFVRAQLVKHEYLIMSEFSRRYITDDIEFYEPDYWRKAAPDKKQGSLQETVDEPLRKRLHVHNGKTTQEAHKNHNELAVDFYKELIGNGTAPEQARMVLPQSLMTAWTWSGTLGAFAKMCQLRLHPEAQYEARLVAQKVYEELKRQFPVAAPLLVEGAT